MYIDNHHTKIYGRLRQVNKAFYYSATRLMFQSFVVRLDHKVQGGHSPFIKFEELCCNANARYVERLVIKCAENTKPPAEYYNPGDFAGSCKRFALRLKEFPSLRSVVLVFFRYPYIRNGIMAGDRIELIIDALRLVQLPKLERLRIFYDSQGDRLFESLPFNYPPIPRGMKSLRHVTLYLGYSRVTKRQDSSICQILEHGESLKYVVAHGIHKLPGSSPTLIHPSAPLCFLRLVFTLLPGESLLELRHFQNTLKHLDLDDVRLTSRSWAEIFIFLQQFSALRRLYTENLGYQNSWRNVDMTESDQQALLQYKAHRPRTWVKRVYKPQVSRQA